MIASIHGRVRHKSRSAVVVDVGGIGLDVHVTDALAAGVQVGQPIDLHTRMSVRETDITLYGFATREERDFFDLLLGVSGVGPRTALSALSVISPDDLCAAIVREDLDVLTRIPGVGSKTAKRMMLDLRDHIDEMGDASGQIPSRSEDVDALNALTALGYSVAEAAEALGTVPADVGATDERILAALRYLGR